MSAADFDKLNWHLLEEAIEDSTDPYLILMDRENGKTMFHVAIEKVPR